MTNAEATGAAVLDGFFLGEQFETVIHASSKVCEGSWQWKPVAAFLVLKPRLVFFQRFPVQSLYQH